MAQSLLDLTTVLDELAALRTATALPVSDSALLDVAHQIERAVDIIGSAPVTQAEPDASSQEWIAAEIDDQLMVVGPGFFLLAHPDTSSVTLTSGEVSWSVVVSDSEGEVGTRITVLDAGEVVGDSTFAPDGRAIDHLDTSAITARIEDSVSEAIDDATDREETIFDAAQTSAGAPGDSVSVLPSSEQPAEESSLLTASSRSAVDSTPTALVAAAAAVVARRVVLPSDPTSEPAAWQATHVVGSAPLAVGGVPSGTFTPGTRLDAGLDVRLIETTDDGWALVECSNTWRCYVAASGLTPLGGSDGR